MRTDRATFPMAAAVILLTTGTGSAAPLTFRELAVRVSDGEAKPVKDAEVYFLADFRPRVQGRTDAEGRWKGRVPVGIRNWSVFARKANVGFDGIATSPIPGRPDGGWQPLPARLSFTLDGARSLRVKTVDRQGKPIAGVKVGPWLIHVPGRPSNVNLSGTWPLWPATDKDGTALLDWLPRRFQGRLPIMISSEDYYSVDRTAPLTADRPMAEVMFTLLPREQLSGRVTHADGKPAKGILIAAHGNGSGLNDFHGSARTDAEGRYTMKVHSEQAYLLAVKDDQWAAPYRADIIVRAGKPVTNVDFTLGRATRLHGRVTAGKEARPAPNRYVVAVVFDIRDLPDEIQRRGSRFQGVSMQFGVWTDTEGRFELHLGPGSYALNGPDREHPVNITIPADRPPAEIVRNFEMP